MTGVQTCALPISAAQAQWEVERKENDDLRAELSSAFDELSAELEQMTAKYAMLNQEHNATILRVKELETDRQALQEQLASAREQLAERTGELNAYKSQLSEKNSA